jgi:hypothetical protein
MAHRVRSQVHGRCAHVRRDFNQEPRGDERGREREREGERERERGRGRERGTNGGDLRQAAA